MRKAIEDILKLPQWAQSKIEYLKRDLEYWKERAQSILSQEPTNITAEIEHGTYRFIPSDCKVIFKMENGDKIEIRFDNADNPKQTALHVYKIGGKMIDSITILPWCSNVIKVK
jgi:hypothetical protein